MPWRHRCHWPPPAWISTLTRSPISNSSTSGPRAATVPIYSWPGVKFLLKGTPPPMLAGDANQSFRAPRNRRGLVAQEKLVGVAQDPSLHLIGNRKLGRCLDAGGV